jgi:hypothetical protein
MANDSIPTVNLFFSDILCLLVQGNLIGFVSGQ